MGLAKSQNGVFYKRKLALSSPQGSYNTWIKDLSKRLATFNWIREQPAHFCSKYIFSDFEISGVLWTKLSYLVKKHPRIFYEKLLYPQGVTIWCTLYSGSEIGLYFFKILLINCIRYHYIYIFFWPEYNNINLNVVGWLYIWSFPWYIFRQIIKILRFYTRLEKCFWLNFCFLI